MTYDYKQRSLSFRLSVALRQLTIVRFFLFIGRLIAAAGRLIGGWLLGLLRAVSLFAVDILFGFKSSWIDLKYAGRKSEVRFQTYVAPPKTVSKKAPKIKKPLRQKATFTPRRSFAFSVFNFAVTLLVIILPFVLYSQWRGLEGTRGRILGSAEKAFASLFSAKNLLEGNKIGEAHSAFTTAAGNFLVAKEDLSAINGLLLEIAKYVPNKQIQLAGSSKHVLAAGELSARLGETLTRAATLPEGSPGTITAFLDNFSRQGKEALPLAQQLEEEIRQIEPESLPEEYREQFISLADKAGFLSSSLEEALRLSDRASTFLGAQMDKRYLLVFQNNAEKRGSGGFIGSFATVDVSRGEITNMTVPKGGSYDTQAGMTRFITAPKPLQLLKPRWYFRDANWWPDWPTSARKLMWFYENSNGPTVDGVISLTPTVMERLLEAIGPIDMTKDYGVIITHENFWQVTQTFSEQKPQETVEPKKIIGDLMTKIMEEVPRRMNPELVMKLVAAGEQSLNEKHVLLHFTDKELAASVEEFGWDGSIAETEGDYLMVANANIGGQKTDRIIRETIIHEAKILPDSSIIDTLTIRREHPGIKNELFTGVRNVNWWRVYVPKGSLLISATGMRRPASHYFDAPEEDWEEDDDLKIENRAKKHYSGISVYEENGKTVFADWSMMDPGETSEIVLTYKLPFRLNGEEPGLLGKTRDLILPPAPPRYSLLVQKQPGAQQTFLRSSIETTKQAIWRYPESMTGSNGRYELEKDLPVDSFSALLFDK